MTRRHLRKRSLDLRVAIHLRSFLQQVNHDRPGRRMLCRIAHIRRNLNQHRADPPIDVYEGSEQFRSAIPLCLGDHNGRDEHFFSLFQVL